MTHPAAVTIDDNYQLIACHVQNIRQLLAKLSAFNLKHQPEGIVPLIPNIIADVQALDQLAAQLIGEAAKRKDSDPCSPQQANSSPPSSRSPSFADS